MKRQIFENAMIGDIFVAEDGTEYRYCGNIWENLNTTHILQSTELNPTPACIYCDDNGRGSEGEMIRCRGMQQYLSVVPPGYYGDIIRRAKEMHEKNRYRSLYRCIRLAEREWLITENYMRGFRRNKINPIMRLYLRIKGEWTF